METKNPNETTLTSLNWMNFSAHHLVPPHSPGGGGLALLWKHEVEVTILYSCNNSLGKDRSEPWYLTENSIIS